MLPTKQMPPIFNSFKVITFCLFATVNTQAKWYDYVFAETSGKTDTDGQPQLKADGSELPDLPVGFDKTTSSLDNNGNLYTTYFLEKEKDAIDPITGTPVKKRVHHLTWLKWNNDHWNEQTATLDVENVQSPRVSVDSMGNAFLFYLNNGALEYAIWSSANQSFDPTRTAIITTEFVVDVHYDAVKQLTRPQVTYLDKGAVKHAFIHPESESETIVDVKEGVFSALSMVVDASGSPHILYHDQGEDTNRNGLLDQDEDVDGDGDLDQGSRNLKYSVYDPALGDFVHDTLGSGHEAGSQNSITIDANGNLHACYYDAKRLELRYLKKNAESQWEDPETVDNNWINGGLNDIAVDSKGHVHISYLGYYGYNLNYATKRNDTSWVNEVIHTTQEQDYFLDTSIEADEEGFAHILTFQHDTRYIHYITNTTNKIPKVDSDNDGAPDIEEKLLHTNPYHPDTDKDGLTDGEEWNLGTQPRQIDSDGDGITDSREQELGLNPISPNSDREIVQAFDSRIGMGSNRKIFHTSPYTFGWFYTQDMGWLYTTPALFPSIYKSDESSWLFFQEGTYDPRWFYNSRSNEWDRY